MSLKPVVAAAIVDSLDAPRHLFVAQRSYPAELKGLYELPGGKMEVGEPALVALRREIEEELGTSLNLGAPLPPMDQKPGALIAPSGFRDPGFAPWVVTGGRLMWVWAAEVRPDAPAPRAADSHSRVDWVPLGDALRLPWIPADIPIVEELLRFVSL